MRHPLFRLGSSVKLAVVLLGVIIVASIAGTIYETSFDSRVARAYIYNAWWFNLWLAILCLNLACSAFSRWPWRRHHTGFLLTHLGIIVLLIGAMIGRRYGIEGTMDLFKGQPPDNRLEVHDERVLRVEDGNDGRGEVRQYPVEIISRHPSPAHPWRLGQTAAGWDLALVDYAPALEASFEPRPAPGGAEAVPGVGQPAVRVRLVSKRLKQTVEQWLLVGDQDHGALDLGLASVQVRAGTAPAVETLAKPPAASAPAARGEPVDEGIFAFALQPDAPVAGPIAEGTKPSGVKVRLKADANGKPTVYLDWQGATWDFDPVAERGKDEDLGGSGLTATVENYWPDFAIGKDNQPGTASDQPHNPAVLVRVRGTLPAADNAPPASSSSPAGAAPNIGTAADNQATVYCDPAGTLTFLLRSSALPEPLRGTLAPGQPINTGWADWQLTAVQALPAAVSHTEFRPVKDLPTTDDKSATSGDPNLVGKGGGSNDASPQAANNPAPNRFEGVRVRLSRGGSVLEQWAASGWEFTVPTAPRPTKLSYDFRVEPLPIGLQLDAFHVKFQEGTDNPESFKSDLRVTDVEGAMGTGSCSMNHPFNFPGNWWNTFTGLTYKMSQASWNPQDRNESVVQVLRDPGWLLKWVGSLVICVGIFMLFYLRPPQRMTSG
ncbi:MAG: hypothetical protein INR65_02455 [Gluconacetobacter diazotrophicus]|nr:hypothetical protein [Gluconacetobacter diazotrophicus]